MSSRPSRGAARLAAILDALPDALLLVNCNGTVVNANAIALETFEAPGTALVGRGLLDLLPDFDPNRIPGSMRRPEDQPAPGVRTPPTRMVARRTDGTPLLVEVTSANLEDGRTTYESPFEAAYADHGGGRTHNGRRYTGDELLMLVVRDLTGTQDTEAELARQQRQTEMILRAAAEGVVGVDVAGRVVLVNPAAAQILGYRASDLGGQSLHQLVQHSRADGSPLPYEETPLADTLRSGRKHRVRGQVLWTREGQPVPVDLTTAPVRGSFSGTGPGGGPAEEQLVGAVLTFTDQRRYNALAARNQQLLSVLDGALREPLEQLRHELRDLAADPAGQLWPEANQVLHHLAAGHSRLARLVENVLSYQRLDSGAEKLAPTVVGLDSVVSAGVDGAVELIGPGRAQFAVHAPEIEAEVDPVRLAQALAHLIADVAGVDATGNPPPAGPTGDSTIVVAAARRGDVVRIEVRGPHDGGDPVHGPIAQGIVRLHGGVLQTHEVPGNGSGAAFVLEVPVSASGAVPGAAAGAARATAGDGTGSLTAPGEPQPRQEGESGLTMMPVPSEPRRGTEGAEPAGAVGAVPHPEAEDAGQPQGTGGAGRPGAEPLASTGAGAPVPAEGQAAGEHRSGEHQRAEQQGATGGPPALVRHRGDVSRQALETVGSGLVEPPRPTGRRRGRPSPAEEQGERALPALPGPGVPGGPAGAGEPDPGGPFPGAPEAAPGSGRRARRDPGAEPAIAPMPASTANPADQQTPPHALPGGAPGRTGRRARRALAQGQDHSQGRGQQVHGEAAQSDPQTPPGTGVHPDPAATGLPADGRPAHDQPTGAVPAQGAQPAPAGHPQAPAGGEADFPLQQPVPPPHGEAQAAGAAHPQTAAALPPAQADQAPVNPSPGAPGAAPPPAGPVPAAHSGPGAPQPVAPGGQRSGTPSVVAASPILSGGQGRGGSPTDPRALSGPHPGTSAPQGAAPPQAPGPQRGSGPGAGGEHDPGISVRTLGQGRPYAQQAEELAAQPETPAGAAPGTPPGAPVGQPVPAGQPVPTGQPVPAGSGRRRKLAAPEESERAGALAQQPAAPAQPQAPQHQAPQHQAPQPPQQQPGGSPSYGREFAIGAPEAGAAEGPEPLDGPNGVVEVTDGGSTLAEQRDAELPPEPLDNPRRLLVWPEPDVSTQQALTDRGYRPVIVHSREEVDAQIAAYPAALFVDPLTGPITRTALQSLRTAAVAAEVPVLVTAGLGQATREAAYGADPAVLLKALAPRDSEQHPPRVLLVEEHTEIAGALIATLERRGMQVAHASSDAESMNVAAQVRPNLVVMDLMQIRRRRAGIIDWLRVNDLLNRTPFVVYTSADMDPAQLPRLASGETVLFLAERSNSDEVQARIVDLLAKIGAN